MLKPVSDSCNLSCSYCFYRDEAAHRKIVCRGKMSEHTLERIVSQALQEAGESCTFGFQGGEPTLRGLDFFRTFIELEQKYAPAGRKLYHLLQTNGLLLDEQWAQFLKENDFLVGLSIDGIRETHDAYRTDASGCGSYDRALVAAELLEQYGVEYNVLTVVNSTTAEHVREIYHDYIKRGLLYQQYVPCFDPIGAERGQQSYSLQPEQYYHFLKELFDLWYTDRAAGKFVYIRYFEELAGMLLGRMPSGCGTNGCCARHLVFEADGSAYPCDFYMTDEWQMGSIHTHTIRELLYCDLENAFLERGEQGRMNCVGCPFFRLCGGGCQRDRIGIRGEEQNYYCKSQYRFLSYAVPKLIELLSPKKQG